MKRLMLPSVLFVSAMGLLLTLQAAVASSATSTRSGTRVVIAKVEQDDEAQVVRITAQLREYRGAARGIEGAELSALVGRIGRFRNEASATTDERGFVELEVNVQPTDKLIRVNFPGDEERKSSLVQIRNPLFQGSF